MRLILGVACSFLFVSLPAGAQSKSDKDKNAEPAQVVSTAEITKIDAKKKTLQVKELVEPTNTEGRGGGGHGTDRGAGRHGGIGGGGRRTGGVGFPGGGGGGGRTGRYPGGNGTGTTSNQAKQYKVFVTNDTVLKLADTDIHFSDLHVGDRVTISGTPKGSKDVEATTITRMFQ